MQVSDESYGEKGTAKPAKRKAKETKSIKVCCLWRSSAVICHLSLVTCHLKGALSIVAGSKVASLAGLVSLLNRIEVAVVWDQTVRMAIIFSLACAILLKSKKQYFTLDVYLS